MQEPPEMAAPAPTRGRTLVKTLVAVAVTGATLWFFVALVDLDLAWQALRGADLGLVAAAAVLLGLTLAVRSARLALAIQQRLQFVLVHIMAVFVFLVGLLPAKVGEFSLPLLLRGRLGVGLSYGLGVLVLLRVYDLLFLAVAGGILVLVYWEALGLPAVTPWLAATGALAALAMALALPVLARLLMIVVPPALRRRKKVMALVDNLMAAATTLTPARHVMLLLWTTALWLVLYTGFHAVSMALDATPGWPASVLAGVAASFAFALPINGVANLGPFQLAWVAVMVPLGVPIEAAATAAFLAHGVALIVNALNVGATTAIDATRRARTLRHARRSKPAETPL